VWGALPLNARQGGRASDEEECCELVKQSSDAAPSPQAGSGRVSPTAQRALHLAVFLHSLAGAGAQRRALTLVNGFADRGHRVDLILVSAQGPLLGQVSAQVRVLELDSPPLRVLRRWHSKRRRQMFASAWPLAKYLGADRPDVLLSAASHANLAALRARRIAGGETPVVLRASNHLSRSSWNRLRWPRLLKWLGARRTYRQADAIIAVSNGIADDLVSHAGVPADRITTILNPTLTADVSHKAGLPIGHPWLAPGGPPVILAAGRFVPQKDLPTLVRAFARVRTARPARLVILGDGPRRPQIAALVRRLHLADDVDLPGFVDNPFAWMSRAAVFVLSSAWEGLPGVLIEAMACGCPVVSTDCPSGPAEILAGGAYGGLVPVGDAAALARAILATLDRPPDRVALVARAGEFASDRAIDRYLDVLAEVAARRPPSPTP